MRYVVHLKHPMMFMVDRKLQPVKKLDFPVEPHIIEQDGERYIELPKTKYRIDESPIKGLGYFVPISYYSEDDVPCVNEIKEE